MGCCISKPSVEEPGPCKEQESSKGVSAAAKYLVQESSEQSNGHAKQLAVTPIPDSVEKKEDGSSIQQAANSVDVGPSAPLMVVWKDTDMPLPLDEQHRWNQLAEYNILDTEPEEAYDRITELCKNLFKVPISMVTFVDKDRVWLKSVQGLPGLKQVDRRSSLCAWTLLSRYPEALVVPDLREDARFKDFPLVVGWPHVRFYAACPLVNSNNMRLGTLCILDHKPRQFSAENTTLLAQLTNMVMREVERKRAMNDALCNAAVRQTSGDSIAQDRQGLMLLDMATPKWSIHLVNDAWQRATGISQEMAAGSHFWDLFEPPAPAQVQAYRLAVEQRRNFELRIPCNSGGNHCYHSHEQMLLQTCSLTSNIASTGSNHTAAGLPPADSGAWGGVSAANNVDSAANNTDRTDKKAVSFAGGASGPVEPARRRSIGGMRYVRFQFRSVSNMASQMGPAISIPPALLNRDADSFYYWATVDIPSAGSQHGGDDSYLSVGSVQQNGPDAPPWAGRQFRGDSDTHSNSSGLHTGPGSDSSSLVHPTMKTTFSLLPEDNPFQDITIGSLLGWGSYGRVHRGYWNGSLVAVKVLEQVAGDFNPRSSLEPLLHHRLSHPNIVAMFDVCTQEVDVCEDGRPLQEVWMVLEHCNRGTLSDAIQRGWLLAVRDGAPQPGHVNMLKGLTTAREVAGALEYLHSQNVLHGDLNGNNILLAGAPVSPDRQDQRGFTAKVADFGLSRILLPDNEQIITRTHGTITHMAPEVITEATHSKAADVYSFGVVLYELLSGVKPYHGMHYAQIVSSITSGKLLQLLPQQTPHLPPELLKLLASCLATNPIDRPTFHEAHQKLLELELEQQMLDAPPTASVVVPAAANNGSSELTAVKPAEPADAAECCECTRQICAQSAAAGISKESAISETAEQQQ